MNTAVIQIALMGWVPIVCVMFALMPARRAMLASFLIAWLFLPVASIPISGLPDITKMNMTCLGILLGVLIFDTNTLLQYKPRWIDLPILIYLVVPLPTNILNGLGAYDGFSSMLTQIATWGLPYFIGRLYITSPQAIRELMMAIMIGGLIYTPLCLYEVRMSPQLHAKLYGYTPNFFAANIRFGGFRPVVFMQSGLAVGLYMVAATLCAIGLYVSGLQKRFWGMPVWLIAVILLLVTILCKALGAVILMYFTLLGLAAWRWGRKRFVMAVIIAIPPLYITTRTMGVFSGQSLVNLSYKISPDRAQSLGFRFENEDLLIAKAKIRPILGWGGWGRNLIHNDDGKQVSIIDGMWIIAFGVNGIVGVTSLYAMLLLPLAMILRQRPPPAMTKTMLSVYTMGAIVSIYAIDCLLNAMVNPLFVLAAGSLASLSAVRFSAISTPKLSPMTSRSIPRPTKQAPPIGASLDQPQ